MTAPAPGLPQDVERALTEAITRAASIGYDGAPDDKYFGGEALDVALDRGMESDKTAALRAAIAAHVAPGGESVAWQIVARDGTPAIAYASLDSAMEHIGPGETMRPLFTRPAPPVSASFEEALAGLDAERSLDGYSQVQYTTILGLDDVRAAHAEAVRVAVEAERGECEKACQGVIDALNKDVDCPLRVVHAYEVHGAEKCITAIRAREAKS